MKVGVRAGGEPGGRPGDGGRVGARRYPVKLTPQKKICRHNYSDPDLDRRIIMNLQ